MCWSYEASILTGMFSYIIAGILYKRNKCYDRWLAMFIMSFSTIQWLEAILWKNIGNNYINKYITKYAIPFVLASEGVAALYGAGMHSKIPTELYIVYFIYAAVVFYICSNNFEYSVVHMNNLQWTNKQNITMGIVYALFLVYPFMLYMDGILKYIIVGGVMSTLLYSVILYNHAWHSNWCFFANIVNIVLLFYVCDDAVPHIKHYEIY